MSFQEEVPNYVGLVSIYVVHCVAESLTLREPSTEPLEAG